MPAKKQSAKGQAGKKGSTKSSGKNRPNPGKPPGYRPSHGEDEAPVIVKGGPQLSDEGGGGWTISSMIPLDFTFDMRLSPLPNIYSQSSGKPITGFAVVNAQTQKVVFCYDSSTEGAYEIIFGSPECDS